MENELIYIGTVLLAFAITLIAYRLGRTWLYLWMVAATLISVPVAGLIISVFGYAVNLGSALYASLFLGTDLLTERYGAKAARTAAHCTATSLALFLGFTQLALLVTPVSYSEGLFTSLETIFATSARAAIAGIISYYIAQYLDIWVYSAIKKITGDRWLWLRNNVSTMTTQVLDNWLFFFIAFYGILPNWFELVLVAAVVRIFVSLLDTPFVYAGKYLMKHES